MKSTPHMKDAHAEEKYRRLVERLSSFGSLMVAFSGGVDSALLLAAAQEALGKSVTAVTAHGPLFPQREIHEANQFCRERGIDSVSVSFDPLSTNPFRTNAPDRCYHCKKGMSACFLDTARRAGARQVAHGANADDPEDYRPGLEAAREAGLKAPLLEEGLGKEEIRRLSRDLGLSTWNRPSRACLASRVPYGSPVTAEKLDRIDRAEVFLEGMGFSQVRVRHHGEVARVEVPAEEIHRFAQEGLRRALVMRLRDIGFAHTALDLEGYVTGSLNRGLA
jgi:pyridinium-3,5-biscarboxylic acid mononucleotide sulfurtransferase